ncbi:hypothetical protein [Dyadobacter aurulentus]|uniref:hypothetical protein n=1 Tax=Dyadobacter sp. UC 10 TaxID=2605428 RepID=UPI0011F17640|nr:hypothetical protein [Dyadobacter sp. UC 10]KAA0990582.1 hypothetical protein FXO21_10630 [Dyadobacter sp. UC 10]
MKTIKLLIFLALFSFQAGATGYVHNMFVAHRKLQSGKEVVSEKTTAKKVKSTVKIMKPAGQVKHSASFFNASLTTQPSESVTLNERILEEGPASFFDSEKNEDSGKSMVHKLIGAFRCMLYAFVGLTP